MCVVFQSFSETVKKARNSIIKKNTTSLTQLDHEYGAFARTEEGLDATKNPNLPSVNFFFV